MRAFIIWFILTTGAYGLTPYVDVLIGCRGKPCQVSEGHDI